MLVFGEDVFDQRKLNSMTKYPKILTYHMLVGKGIHQDDELNEGMGFGSEHIEVTEKVDGENTRIILYDDDFILGSNEELIYANNDRIINNSCEQIVNTLVPVAQKISSITDHIKVVYLEVYGGNLTTASREYTKSRATSCRLLDIFLINMKDAMPLFKKEVASIASWRDHGGQSFYSTEQLNIFSAMNGIERVPILETMPGDRFPTTLQGTYEYLNTYKRSKAIIDQDDDTLGMSEGIVVRNYDRSLIRKLRIEDYVRSKKAGTF